ncbi:MAG TPA: hypothetical protein VHH72_03710 [Solirubrobacterales bacterium]|jgi:hypothetical protein|nr:hypothetical protein [Solirubrobacterales bacterium]
MATIRSFEPDDLPAVRALMGADPPGWDLDERLLLGTLVDHPWTDSELPSLVAIEEDGRLVGFIGSQPRVMHLGGRRLRGVCCSHLVADVKAGSSAVGALLLRRLLSAGQDLTFTDSANETVLRMWLTFGGDLDHSRACDWMLVLRPARWLRSGLRAAATGKSGRHATPVAAVPFQAAGRKLAKRAFPPHDSAVAGTDATAAEIADLLPALARRARLAVAYDTETLGHDLGLASALLGSVVSRLVRRHGEPIGWYAYVPRPDGLCRVLHLDAIRGEEEAVLGELVDAARSRGGSVLCGRMEPNLQEPLRGRFAVLGFARRPLIHARDPEVRAALAASSLLTQLSGEWWVA